MFDTTANRADEFVKRQGVWQRLTDIFRRKRPDEAALTQVSLIATVAIDQVFDALHVDAAEQATLFPVVKDYAECAGLYGWVMGREAGFQEGVRQAHLNPELIA